MYNKILKLSLFSLFLFGLVLLPNISLASDSVHTTVQILGFRQYLNGTVELKSAGSGTIINSDGDVLTNAHVVFDDDKNKPYDAFSVCVIEKLEDVTECRFTATLKRFDEKIDLAVLNIDETPSWGTKLSSFSFISIDSTVEPEVGDKVSIEGYPSTGGDTISSTQGQISGFTEINGFKYLKTDADIDAGNSGGIMFDDEGRFLGVPSYVASYYENSGRVLHIAEVAKWLASDDGEDGETNTQATGKLRAEWKRFYQAKDSGALSYSTDPKLSVKVPDGWTFFSVSDDGFALYKKNNAKAIISVGMISNGFKLDMTAQEKLDVLNRMEEDDYENHQIMKVDGSEALHVWNEASEGAAHVIIVDRGYIEVIISYTVPKNDEVAVLKEVNTFLSSLKMYSSDIDDPSPLQSLNVSKYPYTLEVPSEWRIALDYLGVDKLAKGLTNTHKIESADFYYSNIAEGATDLDLEDGLDYDIKNYLPEDAVVTFKSVDLQIDGLPGWIIFYEYKNGRMPMKTVSITVLDDKYELYFDYGAESDIFEQGLQNFISTLNTIKTDTNGGKKTTYIPLPSSESISGLNDISGHRYRTSIENLVEMKVIGGYPDGSFKPENPVNRAEALKIILQGLRSMQAQDGESAFVMPQGFNMFSDLKSDEWYATYVAEGVDKKIINGYPDGTFKGGNTVNLSEALKMALQAYGAEVWSGDTDPWYKKYFDSAYSMGILPADLTDPGKLLTRAELAYIVDKLISQK